MVKIIAVRVREKKLINDFRKCIDDGEIEKLSTADEYMESIICMSLSLEYCNLVLEHIDDIMKKIVEAKEEGGEANCYSDYDEKLHTKARRYIWSIKERVRDLNNLMSVDLSIVCI